MEKKRKKQQKKLCCIPEVNKGNTFFRCRGVKIIDLRLVCRPHSPCRPLLTVSGRRCLLHDDVWRRRRPCWPCCCGCTSRSFPPRNKNRLVLGGGLRKVREESWLFPVIMGRGWRGTFWCRRHAMGVIVVVNHLLWTVQTRESLSNGLTNSCCVIGVSLVSLFDENATMAVSQTKNGITNECHCPWMSLSWMPSLNVIIVLDDIVLECHCPWCHCPECHWPENHHCHWCHCECHCS